jgi:malto-oligosyltrehalose trehalohydrolase
MPHGAEIGVDRRVAFRLWAPGGDRIEVAIDGGETIALEAGEEGWRTLSTDRAKAGSRYQFVLPDGMRVPDPASRFQPDDVHGPSEVIDPAAFTWTDDFEGRPWNEAVVYELHVGAFTPEGTFEAASGKLDHLAALGVTAIEIMPVSDFPGARNWGYDGVLPYAPDSRYGRPDDFKSFVQQAHARGIMVMLDVVYNHFGPDGNYLPVYAPDFFTDRHKTPWGAGINYDGGARAVRDFVIHNALYWLEEYNLDGLRLDAVHAIIDDSTPHLLEELSDAVRAMRGERATHLVLENEDNSASRLRRDADGSYTAQWNDDVHHVLHVAATGEDAGYYKEYAGKTDLLGRALAEGFAFQGETMEYSERTRGEPSGGLPPGAFVAFAQNHDQIGNRAFGDRLSASVPRERLRALAAIVLLLPQTPMLFMGEEWGAKTPFPFFCDFEGDLADAVRQGRRDEFKRFPQFQDPAQRDKIPDPLAEATFLSAKLDWDRIDTDWLEETTALLALRRRFVEPLLDHIASGGTYRVIGDGAVAVEWDAGDAGTLRLLANLSDGHFDEAAEGEVFHAVGETGNGLGPWSVVWSRSVA